MSIHVEEEREILSGVLIQTDSNSMALVTDSRLVRRGGQAVELRRGPRKDCVAFGVADRA